MIDAGSFSCENEDFENTHDIFALFFMRKTAFEKNA